MSKLHLPGKKVVNEAAPDAPVTPDTKPNKPKPVEPTREEAPVAMDAECFMPLARAARHAKV